MSVCYASVHNHLQAVMQVSQVSPVDNTRKTCLTYKPDV